MAEFIMAVKVIIPHSGAAQGFLKLQAARSGRGHQKASIVPHFSECARQSAWAVLGTGAATGALWAGHCCCSIGLTRKEGEPRFAEGQCETHLYSHIHHLLASHQQRND